MIHQSLFLSHLIIALLLRIIASRQEREFDFLVGDSSYPQNLSFHGVISLEEQEKQQGEITVIVFLVRVTDEHDTINLQS